MKSVPKTGLPVLLFAMFFATQSPAQSSQLLLDRSDALSAAHSINTDPWRVRLTTPDALADGAFTIDQLNALASRSDWPLPARERAIYEYTRSLAAMDRQRIDPAILEYLTTYQPQVMVYNEEHREARQPLFNIRAAASGVENRWQRLDSTLVAAELIKMHAVEFPDMYLEAGSDVARAGYLDALRQADRDSIHSIGVQAVGMLATHPPLSPVVAIAALADLRGGMIERLLADGEGPQMASTLRAVATQLNRDELATLLKLAIEKASTENAALAIANWWPELGSERSARQLLLDQLNNPDLGSAAALALANHPDVQTLRDLQQIAAGDSLAAKRAQMSLDISRRALLQGNQP